MASKTNSFICIIGIDGSGKTTLASTVAQELYSRDKDYIYVYGLMTPALTKPLLSVGRRIFTSGKSKKKNYKGFLEAKKKGMKKYPFLYLLYRGITFVDCYPQVFWKISIPLLKGKKIVSDRYIYDLLVDMELNSESNVSRIKKSLGAYFRVLPKPDKVYLLDVPPEVAISRKSDIPDIHYLQVRRYLYQSLADDLNMIILDGAKPIETLSGQIISSIYS